MRKRAGAFIANIIALVVSFLITYVLRFGWEPDEPAFHNVNDSLVLMYLVLSFLAVWVFFPQKKSGKASVLTVLKDSFLIVLFMAAVFSTLVYATHIGEAIPRMFFGYFFVIDFVLTLFCSLVIYFMQKQFVERHKRKTVVFTDIKDKEKVVRKLLRVGGGEMEIIGLVALRQDGRGKYYKVEITNNVQHQKLAEAGLVRVDPSVMEIQFEAETSDYSTYLKRHLVEQAVMTVERLDRDKMRDIVDMVGEMGIDSMITMDSFSVEDFQSRLEELGTMQVIRFAPRIFSEGELMVKRIMDIVGAIVGCVICVVVGIFVAPLILITDGRPVIFKQKRVGKNGKYFEIYKFRSMYKDAEERRAALKKSQNEMGDERMFKMKDDPRVTKVGKFLRKTSLDELPQFFNVLKGDMSLVGTRPPMLDEYEKYSRHHKRRLTLKPGITGLWQVSGRSEITDFEEIVQLDCYYIDHWSVLYDIKIMLMTIKAVLTGKGSE